MPSFVTVTPSASSAAVRPAISVFFVLHLIYVDLSLLNASNISSVLLSPNFLRKYPASSSGTEYFTDKYLSVFVLLSGYSILSIFLAIFLKTPFTKPRSVPKFFFTASFTASLQTAEAGTLSIYFNW